MIPFAVLNPGGRDPEQLFPNGAGTPADAGHAPVNYHAYAACLKSGFYRDVKRLPSEPGVVLILLRQRLGPAVDAVKIARARGWKIWIALKEVGSHQIADFLNDPKRLAGFRQLCGESDGCLASTPDAAALYRAFGARNVTFMPTPYPVEETEWDFSAPATEREGIWIGTREFDVPTRNHASAIAIALELGCRVSVMANDSRAWRRLQALGNVHLVEGPLPYSEYLRQMARHRVVFQLDQSRVPGQVAGDALLTRTPCVGGDGAIEQIAFPETGGWGRTHGELADLLRAMLSDANFAEQIRRSSERLAKSRLSFSAVGTALGATLKFC